MQSLIHFYVTEESAPASRVIGPVTAEWNRPVGYLLRGDDDGTGPPQAKGG
jgi:hypothetical protein